MRPIPVLGTVTPGRERYCPVLSENLDQMWPGHAPLYFALPTGRTAPYDRVIQTGASTWLGTLLAGLQHVRDELGATHVFMLLEDHTPLWPCDVPLLNTVFTIAEEESLQCVVFTKYVWPWDSTTDRVDDEGRIIGWRAIDIATIRGHRFARVPKDFFRYNQAQPALWHVGYYIEIVEEALRRGLTNPWQFESYIKPDQAQHYVSEYKWPSWSNGYLDQGKIDWRAIRMMKLPEAKRLRDTLLRERFPGVPLPGGALFALGETLRHAERLFSLPGRAARRVQRRVSGSGE